MVNKIIIGLVVVVLIVIGVVFFYPQLSKLTTKHYTFNEEIKGFPIGETSVTFTGWRIVNGSSMGFQEDTNVVIVTFEVRNIGDTTLNTVDFVSATAPILKYGNGYFADPLLLGSAWGWTFSQYIPMQLLPNQSLTNGFIEFEIISGTQPTQLVFPNKESPSIVIDFG